MANGPELKRQECPHWRPLADGMHMQSMLVTIPGVPPGCQSCRAEAAEAKLKVLREATKSLLDRLPKNEADQFVCGGPLSLEAAETAVSLVELLRETGK